MRPLIQFGIACSLLALSLVSLTLSVFGVYCSERIYGESVKSLCSASQASERNISIAEIEDSAIPIKQASYAGFVVCLLSSLGGIGLFLDYTRSLQRARQEAELASQLKSEFLSNMSHELRTPLTAILGFTDNLIHADESSRSGEWGLDSLFTIQRNGRHLHTVINDILDLSKIEACKLDVEFIPCSPLQIAYDTTKELEIRALRKGLFLRIHCDSSIPETATTDPTRLKQVLLNLVSNAIKFTDTGGVDLHVHYDDEPTGGNIRFTISDSGIGMSDEQLAKIFLPFVQADKSVARRFGGTGLGLAIAQSLVDLLGGSLSVSSQVGEGSVFCFGIPTGDVSQTKRIMLDDVREEQFGLGRTTRSDEDARLSCRVLLAEDGIDNQRLVSFILEKAGASVSVAENGRVALEMVESSINDHTPFDIILMDMQMPMLDGYQTTTALRESGFETPIIALTAHAMTGEEEKCLAAGCDAYVSKPIDRKGLVDTIARQMSKGTTASPGR